MAIWAGVVIVVIAFYCIIEHYDTRMVLFVAGMIMCWISGEFLKPFDQFISQLTAGFLSQVIACACAYAHVMRYTQCDQHLAVWLMRYVTKVRSLMIPMAIIVSWLIAFALMSPAGMAAAIGPVLIPIMIKAGIHPAAAASAMLVASWGNFVNFGDSNALIASIAGVDIIDVVGNHFTTAMACLFLSVVLLTIIIKIRKEDYGYVPLEGEFAAEGFYTQQLITKVNYMKAALPFLPIVVVVLGLMPKLHFPRLSVPQAMLICTVVSIILTRCKPGEAVRAFGKGIGYGFGEIVTIICAANVFTAGMNSVGIIGALDRAMANTTSLAAVSAFAGPFLIAFISGSGDAATLAFNTAVTPLVANLGLNPMNIGSLAFLSSGIGRSMSPVAGVAILCAGFARVSPVELTKRCAIPCFIAGLVGMLMLGFL